MATITLQSILFHERREQAASIIAQLEAGYLTTKLGQKVELKYLSLEDFHRLFTKMTSLENIMGFGGYFSTAMIDLAAGSLECVIKFGYPFNDMRGHMSSGRNWKNDYFWNYAAMVQDLGGKNYCKAFPDVYWMGTAHLQNSETVEIAVIEFVNVDEQYSTPEGIIGRMLASFHDSNYGQIIKLEMHGDPYGGFPSLQKVKLTLDKFGWSSVDLAKFIKALREVGGNIDVHAGNFGTREDGSLCVFDPLSYNF